MTAAETTRAARLIFWDFDGVIKESVDVKTEAFVRLFESFGSGVAERVRLHHEANGGMSRFEKVPLYLGWTGEDPTEQRVGELCTQFGALVMQGVIESPWVPGVEAYLRGNRYAQIFVLVSATPQAELDSILEALDLRSCFVDVFGAPMSKTEAVRVTLARHRVAAEDGVLIGDAKADREAAHACAVSFVLRRHASNAGVFTGYRGPSLADGTVL